MKHYTALSIAESDHFLAQAQIQLGTVPSSSSCKLSCYAITSLSWLLVDNIKFMKKVDLVVVTAGVTFDANAAHLKAVKGRDIIKDN